MPYGLADHYRGVPFIESILVGIPQLSDLSPRYSHNIHTHTRGIPAAPSPSPCTPLVQRRRGVFRPTDDDDRRQRAKQYWFSYTVYAGH